MSKRGHDDGARKSRDKKRRSRWASDTAEKTFIPGMPTILPTGLDTTQEEMYLLQLQIEDITRRLRSGDFGIPPNPEDRSPSPEPIYNQEGKRLNTREYRTRRKLEEDRHKAVQKLLELNPEYKPPSDYKPPAIKITDKVYIPQDEHPEINFVGLLIGPRGNTLKTLEKDTGAKVIIRGKGSVKEGKVGRKDGLPMPGEDEPLHAFITGSTQESVTKCVERINKVIQQGIEIPESQNDLRKQQLRELALLNGTLRENEGLAKLKAIAEAQTIATNTIVCSSCGGAGHLASDCKAKRDNLMSIESAPIGSAEDRAKMDSEYTALMAELGVAEIPAGGQIANHPAGGARGGRDPRTGPRPWQAPPPRLQQQRITGTGSGAGGMSALGPLGAAAGSFGGVSASGGGAGGGSSGGGTGASRSMPPPLMSQPCNFSGPVDTDWLTTHPPPPGTEPSPAPPRGPTTAPPVGAPPPPTPGSANSSQWRESNQIRPLPPPPPNSNQVRPTMNWPGPPPPRPPGPPPIIASHSPQATHAAPWMSGPPPPMPPPHTNSNSGSVPPPSWMGAPPPLPPPLPQPPMPQPPMSQPPMSQPPMSQPPMSQPPMSQPPMSQPPMSQPPLPPAPPGAPAGSGSAAPHGWGPPPPGMPPLPPPPPSWSGPPPPPPPRGPPPPIPPPPPSSH